MLAPNFRCLNNMMLGKSCVCFYEVCIWAVPAEGMVAAGFQKNSEDLVVWHLPTVKFR